MRSLSLSLLSLVCFSVRCCPTPVWLLIYRLPHRRTELKKRTNQTVVAGWMDRIGRRRESESWKWGGCVWEKRRGIRKDMPRGQVSHSLTSTPNVFGYTSISLPSFKKISFLTLRLIKTLQWLFTSLPCDCSARVARVVPLVATIEPPSHQLHQHDIRPTDGSLIHRSREKKTITAKSSDLV